MIKILAPGRICLFGDHQDYLGLPIIGCAINRAIRLEAKENSEQVLRIDMPDISEVRIIDLQFPIKSISKKDYFVSSLEVLQDIGGFLDRGFDVQISGNIPINSGLSSSSAIVVAWIAFLLKAFTKKIEISPEYIAHLAYRAEVLEYKAPGGLMDQYCISIGKVIFLNTINGHHTIINKKIGSLIVGESGVPKQTLGVLKNLRGYAENAIAQVHKKVPNFKISEATIKDYELYKQYVSEGIRPIFYAAIRNHEITQEAFKELQYNTIDLVKIGELMTAHHYILKDILKITVPIIDTMVEGALATGALGAKIVGSGGGGSIVAIANIGEEEKVIKGMLVGGAKSAYKIDIANGVTIA